MSTESPPNRDVSRRADVSALLAVLAITMLFASFRFYYDNWLADFDIFTYFLPAFGYLGDRLRDGDIPAWNPHFSGGQPHAGDPGAGWMFLPAMISFTIFDAINGFKTMVLIELLTAGTTTYLFCRRIGMVPIAAMVGGLALSTGPMIYGSTSYVTIIGQITPFLALGMFATESALQAHRISARLAWSSAAGIALIQTFLAWPQGFLYTGMMIGGWIIYRCFGSTNRCDLNRTQYLRHILTIGGTMATTALTWGAAGILPRLDFIRQSSIPGGDYSNVIGGNYAADPWTFERLIGRLIQNTPYWRPVEMNTAVLILAIFAVLVGRNRFGIPLFAVATVIFIDISIQHSLTRWVFNIIPGFERIHSHRPTAGNSLFFFPIAVLAAAAIQLLWDRRRERFAWMQRVLPLLIVAALMYRVGVVGEPTSWLQLALAATGTILVLLPLTGRLRYVQRFDLQLSRVAIAGLVTTMLVFPNVMDIVGTVRDPQNIPNMTDEFGRDDVVQNMIETSMARTEPDSAAEFLQDRQDVGEVFRYAPYFGNGALNTGYMPSSSFRREPWMIAILANARASRLGLEQVGGYNPVHLSFYTEYMNAVNGTAQDYHWLELFQFGLEQSPLLDMLNVRYVLVPAIFDKPVPIASWGNEVYRDEVVVIYENPNVYARAWIVHDVRPAMDGQELQAFLDGSINGRHTAFVDGVVPPVAPATGTDLVRVTDTTPESITIMTSSTADGLLVVSDSWAEGWSAYIDGNRTEVMRANHAFRGVAVPAGHHEVIMRYEPRALTIGLWSTGIASAGLIGIWSWAILDHRRPGSRPTAIEEQ